MEFENVCLGVFAMIITSSIKTVESEISGDFALTFEGFLPLVDADYRSKTAQNNEINEKISLSMYRYYMVQHLYARLALIRQTRDPTDQQLSQFIKLVYSTAPLLPRSIGKYLLAIGDIEEEESINVTKELKYAFLVWPNGQGHFGRIDATNHWKYMSLPAPSVMAQAIQEDYSYTNKAEPATMVMYEPHWNLRGYLVPYNNFHANSFECESPGLPTQNLLGWKPCTELTSQQRRILQSCGITRNIFETVNLQFYLNPCLIEYIYNILHDQPRLFYVEDITPKMFHQSKRKVNMLSWLTELHEDFDRSFSRTAVHTDKDFEIHMAGMKDDSKDILAMAFRVEKGNNSLAWSIYDWSEYQCVPKDWIDTSNTILDYYRFEGDSFLMNYSSDGRNSLRRSFLKNLWE